VSVSLDFQKLPGSGHITVAFYPLNGFANYASPTVAELNAATPTAAQFSKSISWNDFGLGVQASNTIDDPSIADIGNVTDRGAAQYGGAVSFYYPNDFDDNSNSYSLTYDAVGAPRTPGYMVVRIDGLKPTSQAFAAGDYVHVMQVLSDGQANSITGEEAFRYTVTWLQQGNLAVYTVVRDTTNTVVTPATVTAAADSSGRILGTLNGRQYTNGLVWSSSDDAVVRVSNAGVYTVIGASAATATITAKDPYTAATDTTELTVS
jgi:hypothetical protein